jgi:hypothetical protein
MLYVWDISNANMQDVVERIQMQVKNAQMKMMLLDCMLILMILIGI